MSTEITTSTATEMTATVGRKVAVGRQMRHESQPEIKVEKEGDQVTKIEIKCGCGELITVHCTYPEAEKARP